MLLTAAEYAAAMDRRMAGADNLAAVERARIAYYAARDRFHARDRFGFSYRYPSGMTVEYRRDGYGNLRAVDFEYGTVGAVGAVSA
jgi:hypothetical protein